MANEKIPTRDLLIEIAGELFAEYGYEGTSVKMIAEKSRQNIAAVNYHFGCKQSLFIETLKFVLGKIMTTPQAKKAGRGIKTGPERERELEHEHEHEFIEYVNERTRFLLSPKTPKWYGELVVRSVFATPAGAHEIEIDILSPDFNYLEDLARRYSSSLEQPAARRWAYSVIGQIFFYVMGRNMILLANNMPAYSEKFIAAVADQISETAIQWLKYQQKEKNS